MKSIRPGSLPSARQAGRWLIFLCGVALTPSCLGFASDTVSIEDRYRATAEKIIETALADESAWSKLVFLCDRIGPRLSGSEGLEKAVEWAAQQMRQDGLENVRLLPVTVPHWVRGREYGRIVAPERHDLHLLGLGGSVATPPSGVTAEVVVVNSFEELSKAGRGKVSGKIVLFNAPYEGYGKTVRYRSAGASAAARLGAAAALIRSVTPVSLQSPHTGALNYASEMPRIPAAAVSVEDAALIQRLVESGEKVTVELYMEAATFPDAASANVIGEIVGRELPNEIVVIGGHIDSWDVGPGAHDNGGGVVVAMQAAAILKSLGLRPVRTLRVVLFTNEENGLAGGRAYRSWIGDRVGDHVAAIEMDMGAETPTGFGVGLNPPTDCVDRDSAYERTLAKAAEIGGLLRRIEATQVTKGGGGADISPLVTDGVPGLGLRTVGTRYFEWHHTEADTVDKVDPRDLRANLAAMAVFAYVLADMPDRLLNCDRE